MISPNLAGNKYNMRKPGMEGHLLFNKAVAKWTKLSHPYSKIYSDGHNK
jgi:hypothetical protein